jgi:neurofibromin 1
MIILPLQDTTILALHIKTRLCQLVDAMMKRRDDLSFRQEMKFRNKLVEYLTDWAMGNSHQVNYSGMPTSKQVEA